MRNRFNSTDQWTDHDPFDDVIDFQMSGNGLGLNERLNFDFKYEREETGDENHDER